MKLYNDSDKSIISFKNIYEMASEGGTPSTSDSENYENGKIPFIKIDDLNQHYLNFAKYFITEKGLKNLVHGLFLKIVLFIQTAQLLVLVLLIKYQ